MKYITAILTLLKAIKEIYLSFTQKTTVKEKENEIKKIEELKKETEENVKKGEIEDINKNLMF